MNGFVEAGYIAVATGLGSYAIWLAVRSKKLNVAVVLTDNEDGGQQRNSSDGT